MTTNETATGPVTDDEVATESRHTTEAPADGTGSTDGKTDAPQKSRHTTSEPAD